METLRQVLVAGLFWPQCFETARDERVRAARRAVSLHAEVCLLAWHDLSRLRRLQGTACDIERACS